MNKLKNSLLAHKIVIGVCLMLIVGIVGVVAYAYTSQNKAPNTVFEGDCVDCDLRSQDQSEQNVDEMNLGAMPGPDIYSDVSIFGTFTYGAGAYDATSTASTTSDVTLRRQDLQKFNYIDVMNNHGAATWTLPATSTMEMMLRAAGGTRTWLFRNSTSTNTGTITFSAGTGMELVSSIGTSTLIYGGGIAELTCMEKHYRSADNENIICIFKTTQ